MTAEGRLARQVATWFGVDLARGGRMDALERVVNQRARASGASSSDDYVARLHGPDDPEVALLLETITVGHTWFFRDPEQTQAIAKVLQDRSSEKGRPEVWVPGCSTGEDAYTVALLGDAARIDVDVLGTDVNPRALERARTARYAEWSTRQISPAHMRRFARVGGALALDAAVARKVRFDRHNLLQTPPSAPGGGGWDVILCRNVLIYFLRTVAARATQRLAGALRPGGWLFLGASEVISKAPAGCAIGWVGSRVAIQRLPQSPLAQPPTPALPPNRGKGVSRRALNQTPFPPIRGKGPGLGGSRGEEPAEARAGDQDAIERALARLEAGRNDEAIMLCAKVLEEDPLRVEAHLVSGMAFHLGKDPESAVRALSSAVLLDPQLWPAFFYLGQALEKLGRDAEASEAYREADARARAAPTRRLGVLDAFKGEIATLARARAARLVE